MRRWTKAERSAQTRLIRKWKPWLYSTGPKTPGGKATASRNAFKHGLRSNALRKLRRMLRRQAKFLVMVRN